MTGHPRASKAPKPAEAIAEGLDEAMIRRVVRRFYAMAREDEVIGPIFRKYVPDARWETHLEDIETFWCASLLSSRRYEGRPMPRHLAITELDDSHFMRWLALFRHTVTELCPPLTAALFIDRSERIANSFRINIAMHRGEDLVFQPPLKRETYP
ncbi:group III truncated hemoglobin [Salipiger abyssi]|uniref:group III truncated hemoglobin n=1 Tax=Salipiger abyssi TaxID=1250539 RepID=UPI001A8C6CB3|nr:group III truncated hemoglobin [Salipiger abyssi]MBN9889869.1 group III truncated hemoglobin [Salipiger abyssi]